MTHTTDFGGQGEAATAGSGSLTSSATPAEVDSCCLRRNQAEEAKKLEATKKLEEEEKVVEEKKLKAKKAAKENNEKKSKKEKPEKTTPVKGNDNAEDKGSKDIIKQATKLKSYYNKVTGNAFMLNKQITTNKEYARINSEQNRKDLEEAIDAVEENLSEATRDFIMHDMKTLNKKYKENQILTALVSFIETKPEIVKLEDLCSEFCDMAKVNIKG